MGDRIAAAVRRFGTGDRRRVQSAAVFLAYLLVASCFLGLRILAHPESTIIGDHYADPQLFVWAFAWWPHAILHGNNPFYTHAIWAPAASTSPGRRASPRSRSPSRR